jgi:hypothetical protein
MQKHVPPRESPRFGSLSSVAPLAIGRWIDIPTLLQRLADFILGEFFLF